MKNWNELVRLVAEKPDTLDLDVLKQALDRIDMLEEKKKTAAESAIADINDDIQKATDKFIKKVEEAVDEKSKEIMTV